MGNYDHWHHFRLDEPIELALDELCRLTLIAKSALMRKYVQEGAARDIQSLADRIGNVVDSAAQVKALADRCENHR